MSNPLWPSSLPSPIADGSLQYGVFAEPALSTNMDAGAPKLRRRFTFVPETMQATVILTGAQWDTLLTFITSTLQEVGVFDWKDFRDGTTATYCFLKRPVQTQMSNQPGNWSVQLNLLMVA